MWSFTCMNLSGASPPGPPPVPALSSRSCDPGTSSRTVSSPLTTEVDMVRSPVDPLPVALIVIVPSEFVEVVQLVPPLI